MKYYYFKSSLPELSMDGAPALSMQDFRRQCKSALTERDHEALMSLLDPEWPPTRHGFVNRWRAAETRLRNAVAKRRAERLKVDPREVCREQEGWDVGLESAVGDAFGMSTPLDRERALDRLRWQQADDLAGYDPFTCEALLAYALKLRLSERWALMHSDRGQDRLESLVKQEAAPATSPDTASGPESESSRESST